MKFMTTWSFPTGNLPEAAARFLAGAATPEAGVTLPDVYKRQAGIYYAASLRLTYLRESWVVCGLFFGAAVDEIMRLVVLPLSALHAKGPYEQKDILLGLGVHMVVIGLPVAWSARRFGG